MKSISIIGYYGAGNLGDELLLKSTINLIESLGSFQINIFSSDTDSTQQDYPHCNIFDKFSLWELISGIAQSEIIVFGGGSIFQDKSSFKSCFYYFAVSLITKLFGEKLVLLGQGIGPFKSGLAKLLTEYAIQMADQISVRDSESYEFAKAWNSSTKLAPDLVWTLNEPNQTPKEKRILISLRSDYFSDEHLITFTNFLKGKTFDGYNFDLIALQDTDLEVLNKLNEQLPDSQVHELYSLSDWKFIGKSLFNRAELSISMRLHALLPSILCGCKCIGLCYDPKVKHLCDATNQPYIELDLLSTEILENKFEAAKLININNLADLSEQYSKLSKELNSNILKQPIAEINE